MDDFETIGRMIASGESIGGDVTAKTLTSGSIDTSGEDTVVYNPGLTLLSSAEKSALTSALHDARSSPDTLKDADEAATYLIGLLDPLKTYELKPYLSRLPLTAFAAYLAGTVALVVAKDVFPFVYVGIVGVAVVVPAVVDVILKG